MYTHEIVISKDGFHFGTMDLKTNITEQAIARAQELRKELPANYKLEMLRWKNIGERVNF